MIENPILKEETIKGRKITLEAFLSNNGKDVLFHTISLDGKDMYIASEESDALISYNNLINFVKEIVG